jgi:serine/threonine-protein kinase
VYSVGILAYELLTGVTPFTGDSALAVAYQRIDNDVPRPSRVIGGVPAQFDDFVLRSTARNPAARFADAHHMLAELDTIVDQLGLPAFRVPAPRNSAQHVSAALYRATRELTRDDWQPAAQVSPVDHELPGLPGHFAGIEMSEFYWARQRSKRALLFWVLTVITLTGLIAAGAWTLGGNIGNLL